VKTGRPYGLAVGLLAALWLLLSCRGGEGERLNRGIPTTAGFQAGINVLAYGNPPSFKDSALRLLSKLEELNVNSISLVIPIFMDSATSSRVYTDPKATINDDNLRFFLRQAAKKGFRVMLRPLIDETALQREGRWRGNIAPEDEETWFASYTALLLKYARMAEQEGVAFLSIGAELKSMSKERARWATLIDEVRRVFQGQITYSANWDEEVPFWDLVDFIGIDAFFPLQAPDGATVPDLVQAWGKWTGYLRSLKAGYNKSVVITEIGLVNQRGAYRLPFASDHGTEIDLQAQANYYKAAFIALEGLVDGFYWWAVDINKLKPLPGSSPSFSPLGKPAEEVLKRYFGQKQGQGSP